MADSVKAMGGREAIEKIKTLHTVMTITVPGKPQTMTVDTSWSRSGGRLTKVSSPMGSGVAGTDGTITWGKLSQGYVLVSDREARQANEQADMIMYALEPDRATAEKWTQLKTAARQAFADKECYRLHYTDRQDGTEGDLYYGVADKLPVGHEGLTPTRMGKVKVRLVMSDWKEEQGVKIPRTMVVDSASAPGAATKTTLDTLEINTLDESVFALPDEVKELAAAQAAKPAGPAETGSEGGAKAGSGTNAGSAGGAAPAAKEIKVEDLTPEQRKTAEGMIDRAKKSGNVQGMKDMVSQIEPMMSILSAEQRAGFQYAMQEIKKEIARLGG